MSPLKGFTSKWIVLDMHSLLTAVLKRNYIEFPTILLPASDRDIT